MEKKRLTESQNHKLREDFTITKSNISQTVSKNSSVEWEVKR